MNGKAESGTPRSTHLDEDRCTELVAGLLTAREARDVMAHLKRCADCESLLQKRAREWERCALGTPEPDVAPRRASRPSWLDLVDFFRRPRAAAAVGFMAAGLAALLLLPRLTGDPVAPLLHQMPPMEEVSQRAAANAWPEALRSGLEAYAARDFDAAATLLNDTGATGALEIYRDLYRASALAWEGQHESAVEVLDRLPFDLLPEPWAGEAQWTLFVSLQASGRESRADSVLARLAEDSGIIGDRAREYRKAQ